MLWIFRLFLLPLLFLASFRSDALGAVRKLTAACNLVLDPTPVLSLDLNGGDPIALQSYFSNLPTDPYLAAKGAVFRNRRFSRFQAGEGGWSLLSPKAFTQARDVNPLFPDVPRTFEPLELALVAETRFNQLLSTFAETLPGIPEDYEVGVHQIRVWADPTQAISEALPVPEGRHRDGVDFIGIYVVSRQNVVGATTHLSMTQEGLPFYERDLVPGQLLVLNDRVCWHYATPIQSMNGQVATRDVFILTAETRAR